MSCGVSWVFFFVIFCFFFNGLHRKVNSVQWHYAEFWNNSHIEISVHKKKKKTTKKINNWPIRIKQSGQLHCKSFLMWFILYFLYVFIYTYVYLMSTSLMVFFTNELIETKLLIWLKVCSLETNRGQFSHRRILRHS